MPARRQRSQYPTVPDIPVELIKGETTRIAVRFDGTRSPVTIQVIDTNRKPLSGAGVRFVDARARSHGFVPQNLTNTDGEIQTFRIDSDSIDLHVTKDGFAPEVVIQATSWITGDRLEVELEPEAVLEVHVRDADGEPAEDIIVRWSENLRGTTARRHLRNTRNSMKTAAGKVRFASLRGGTYTLRFQRGRETLGSLEVLLESGEKKSLEFYTFAHNNQARVIRRVEGATEIEIRYETASLSALILNPDGSPAAALPGHLAGPGYVRFTTDTEGYFEIAELPRGTYSWSFPELQGARVVAGDVLVLEGDREVTYRFRRGIAVRIDARFSGAKPTRFSSIHLSEDGGRTVLTRGDAADTHYWPEGSGMGFVQAAGYAPGFFEITDPDQQSGIEVMLKVGGTLVVEVMEVDGTPMPRQSVRLSVIEGDALPDPYCLLRTGTNGTARLQLGPGQYLVTTVLGSGEEHRKTVTIQPQEFVQVRFP